MILSLILNYNSKKIPLEIEEFKQEEEGEKEEEEIEVLRYQILSLFDDLNEEYLLIDDYGREIKQINDIIDLYYEEDRNKKKYLQNNNLNNIKNEINLWILSSNYLNLLFCSSKLFQEDILQTYTRIIDTNFEICSNCIHLFDKQLLVSYNNSLHKFKCNSFQAIEFGLSYQYESLPLSPLPPIKLNENNNNGNEFLQYNHPIGKYFRRKYLYNAILLQPNYQNILQPNNNELQFEARFQSHLSVIKAYENPVYQQKARNSIDYNILLQYTQEYFQSEPNLPNDLIFLKSLIKWFKKNFFKWCNRPACTTPNCDMNGTQADSLGMGQPNQEEKNIHWAGRVEIYKCTKCQTILRFPRINNPASLLDTKKGRCGEWANCFGLICRSMGFDTRWVIDYTDHVWVEVWCDSQKRYLHIDPCEMVIDTPLLYEVGWKKKLSYLFSFSRFGVTDSTSRYSRHINGENSIEMRQRRSEVTEKLVMNIVKKYDEQLENEYINQINNSNNQNSITGFINFNIVKRRTRIDGNITQMKDYINALNNGGKDGIERLIFGENVSREGYICDIPIKVMKERKRSDYRELMKLEMMIEGEDEMREEEKKGRQSGDRQWREQRGEISINEKDISEQEVLIGDIYDRYSWIKTKDFINDKFYLFSPHSKYIDIFISSISMNDKLDNSKNGFISNLDNLYSLEQEGGPNCGGGVFTTHSIMINGISICRAGRGHNVVIICLNSGQLIGSKSFDTHGSDGFEMIQYLLTFIEPLNKKNYNRYLILISVIDSGENLSESSIHLLERLTTLSSPLLFSSFTNLSSSLSSSSSSSLIHKISHRQSYLLSSIITSGLQEEVLWSYYDLVPSEKGPLTTRLQITLPSSQENIITQTTLSTNNNSNNIVIKKWNNYYQRVDINEKYYNFENAIPLKRYDLSNNFISFDASHEKMCLICDEIENIRMNPVVLLYINEKETEQSSIKLIAYIFSLTSLTSLKEIDEKNAKEIVGVYIKYSTTQELVEDQVLNNNIENYIISPYVNTLKYIPLGGMHYPDTVSFDSTIFLLDLLKIISCPLEAIVLSEVNFYGDNIIRGVKCTYSHPYGTFSTPLIYAGYEKLINQEKEKCNTINLLRNGDIIPSSIVSVSIRYGGLIDSITLHLSNGESIMSGGQGGSEFSTIEIPDGYKVVGFYGGVGGHIHHFGVVVAVSNKSIHLLSPSYPPNHLSIELLQLIQTFQLSDCGMIGGVKYGKTTHMMFLLQRNSLFQFIDTLQRFISSSDSTNQQKIQAINCILIYTKNILKDIHEPKFRKVNFTNSRFIEKVLSCPDALELMGMSPLCWVLRTIENVPNYLESIGYQWIQETCRREGEDGIEYRKNYEKIWLEWIEKYVSLLENISKVYLVETN